MSDSIKVLNSSLGFYGNYSAAMGWNKKILTAEETKALVCRMKKGDLKARDELIVRNWSLVCKCVQTVKLPDADFEDLLQEGIVRFLEICGGFNPEKANLSTYVWNAIKQHTLRKNINVPERIYKFSFHLNNATMDLRRKLNREPSYDEVAEYMGISKKIFSKNVQKVKAANTVSLDSPVDENDSASSSVSDTISDEKNFTPEELSMRRETIRVIREAVSNLSTREQQVVILRNNLNETEEGNLSFREIGERMHLSYETVRKVEEAANLKLKRFLSSAGIAA